MCRADSNTTQARACARALAQSEGKILTRPILKERSAGQSECQTLSSCLVFVCFSVFVLPLCFVYRYLMNGQCYQLQRWLASLLLLWGILVLRAHPFTLFAVHCLWLNWFHVRVYIHSLSSTLFN